MLGALTLSCSDSTAPKNTGLTVTLTADSPTPEPIFSDTPDGPKIACNIGLTAAATGKGAATWSGAISYWYIGTDRSTAVDTLTNPADDIAQGFDGQTTIAPGQSLKTIWYFYDYAPFEVKLGFSYTTHDGKTGTAFTHFRCGPDPAAAVVPTITQLTVPVTSGALVPGDTISVSYKESSTSGVWLSIVDITGAFFAEQRVGERFSTSVDSTVKFVVPSVLLNSGVPLTVSLRAYDDALVGRAQALNTQLEYVDSTPPRMSAVSLPTGQYGVGDTLHLSVYAQDDNLLGWLVYQLGAPANVVDSAAAPPGHAWSTIDAYVPVKPAWVGQPTVTIAVHDAAGLTSASQSTAPGALSIYPEVDLPATAPLSLASTGSSDDMVYDQKRDLMYVGLPDDDRIAVFSPATMAAQPSILLPGAPAGMDLSLGGDSLLVAVPSSNAIEVIDLTHPGATPTAIHLSVLDTVVSADAYAPLEPSGLRIAANGKMLVFLTWQSQKGDQVVEVDLTSGAQRIRTDARNLATVYSYWTQDVGRSLDRSRIFILASCDARYDAPTDTFSACTYTGLPFPSTGVSVDSTGSHVARGVFLLSGDLSSQQDVGDLPGHDAFVAIAPDGATVYVADGRSIRGRRLSDLTLFERIPIPIASDRVVVAPNGKWLLAFQTTGGPRVTRVDLQ